jgi:D-serine dehydratase
LNIDAILAGPVDSTVKGMPRLSRPLALRDIGRQGWNVLREDLRMPLAVLRQSSLDHNRAWMRGFLSATGIELAPHGKTSMSPQLFQHQLADGAWGITCANIAQLQVYRSFGVNRVLLANELANSSAVRYVAEEIATDPDFELYAFVDSLDGVALVIEALAGAPSWSRLRLLVEVGRSGGRTGVRTLDEATAIGRAIAAAPGLALCGVGCFEAVFTGDDASVASAISALFDLQETAARALAGSFSRDLPVLLTAGGSQFPDVAAKRLAAIEIGRPATRVLRSGCYLTHDSVHYAQAAVRMLERSPELALPVGPLVPALELWASIQSRPESTLAFANFGKRDTGADLGLPEPLSWYRAGLHTQPEPLRGHRVVKLNDQHAFLEVPADSPLRIGDMLRFGISHPCTTFDKWQVIPIVDDGYQVIDAIRTFF